MKSKTFVAGLWVLTAIVSACAPPPPKPNRGISPQPPMTGAQGDGDLSNQDPTMSNTQVCGKVSDGEEESREVYAVAAVTAGKTCEPLSQARTCIKGKFSDWLPAGLSETCAVPGKANCGKTPHGALKSEKAYPVGSVSAGQLCESQMRTHTCNNGTWSEWSPASLVGTCKVEGSSSCGDTPHGSQNTRTAFASATVSAGQTCTSVTQTQTCSNGLLTAWTPVNLSPTCVVQGFKNCGAIPHGGQETRVAFPQASVSAGQTCEAKSQTRTCTNGVMSGWTPAELSTSCVVAGYASCGPIPHSGTDISTGYSASTVPAGQTCQSQSRSRSCSNGVLGAWSPAGLFESCVAQSNVPTCSLVSKLPAAGFSDTSTSAYKIAIDDAAKAGIIAGFPDGKFKPTEGLTRAQGISLILESLKCLKNVNIQIPSSASLGTIPFSDVQTTHWAAPKIVAAHGQGLIAGYSDGTFRPDETLTKADFIQILYKAVTYVRNANSKPPESPKFATSNPFSDVPSTASGASAIIKMSGYCKAAEVRSGTSTAFMPASSSPREYSAYAALQTRKCLFEEVGQ